MIPTLPINLELHELGGIFEEEVSKLLFSFIEKLTIVLDSVDEKIAKVQKSGFDETLIERMIREVKEDGYDKIDRLVTEMV